MVSFDSWSLFSLWISFTDAFSFPLDEEQQAHRRYKKDLVHLKPDLSTYNRQKEEALGLTPGALTPGSSAASSSSNALVTAFDPQGGSVRHML